MKFISIFLLFLSYLFGSEIINTTYYNYPEQKKVVVLFSLDEPFKGKISKISEKSYLIYGVNLNSIESKKFNGVIKSLLISPNDKNSVKIDIYTDKKFDIGASVTKVGYGLKISIKSLGAENKQVMNMNIVSTPNSEESSFNMLNYILVMTVLIVLIIVLLVIKKKGIKLPIQQNSYDYKIIFKRAIDTKNQLMMIEVMGVRYLLLVGDNTIMLDKFNSDNENSDENVEDLTSVKKALNFDFDEVLENSKIENYKLNASKLNEV